MQTLCARVQHAYSTSRARSAGCQTGLIIETCISLITTKASIDGNKEIKEITQERDYETMMMSNFVYLPMTSAKRVAPSC